MKSLAAIAFTALIFLLADECATAQSATAVGPRGSLRSRLPFSSPADANAGQMRTSSRSQSTGGAASFVGNYANWGLYGYPVAGTPSAQIYQRGGGPMLVQQQRSVNGIGINGVNQANSQQGELLTDQRGFDSDYGWMDFDPTLATTQRAGAANSAGGSLSNDTANATNVQGYTGAAVPGQDQVPTSGNAARANAQPINAQPMNQQPSEWRFYQTPLMDRGQARQSPQTNAPAGAGTAPAQSQRPNGVAEAASSGPIKY